MNRKLIKKILDQVLDSVLVRDTRKEFKLHLGKRLNKEWGEVYSLAKRASTKIPAEFAKLVEAMAKELRKGLMKSGKISFKSRLHSLSDAELAELCRVAKLEKLPSNIKGKARELLLRQSDEFKELMEEMKKRARKANDAMKGRKKPAWSEPKAALGGRDNVGNELGDVFVVAHPTDLNDLPVHNGKKKKLWIMANVESKSSSNKHDVFDQLEENVKRIQRDGLVLDGVRYSPDEIHIEMPTTALPRGERTTLLIGATPDMTLRPKQAAIALSARHIDMIFWSNAVAPESELDVMVKLILDLVE